MYSRLPCRFAVQAALLATVFALGTAHPARADSFEALDWSGVSDGHPYFLIDNPGNSYFNSPTPDNISQMQTLHYSDGNGNDITFNMDAAANYRGFFSSGVYAYGLVQNAYYPTTTGYGTTPPFGYYVQATAASWTKMTFVSPESVSDPSAIFHWHVEGTPTANFGTANSRLDFAVEAGGVSNVQDVFNQTNRLEQFGAGDYAYNTGIAVGTPLDFLFWSAAYWEVDPNVLQTLGTGHENITGTAAYMDTFNLDSIQLINGNGSPITQWSLLDQYGKVIFTQDGRAPTVPEPGTLAFLGTGALTAVSLLRRRRATR